MAYRIVPNAGRPTSSSAGEQTHPSGPISSEEVQQLKATVSDLDRKTKLLAAVALSGQGAPSAENPTPAAHPAKVEDPRSGAEIQQDMLRGFDGVLANDSGDPRDRKATAETMRSQLLSATAKHSVRVASVQCAVAFCKAVLEEDTTAGQINTGDLITDTPFLGREAMFDYEKEGSRRRTIIYAARDGQLLPRLNGSPAPGANSGVAPPVVAGGPGDPP